ncbi:MAG: VWA domain-containing protein [Terriglobia bacterium]
MKPNAPNFQTTRAWQRVLWCVLGVVLVTTPVLLRSQQNPPSSQTPTLKISINVVNVLAIVKDKKGHLIPDLNKDDFELTEDNVPQEIRYFSKQADTPLTLGILVDTSPSQQRVLPLEQEEGKTFIRQVLRPKDMAFVLHFDLDVELLQDFTGDKNLLAKAIDETVINGGGAGPMGGTFPDSRPCCTYLYDAVYLSSNEQLKNEVGRKVIIVLTDGEDEGSKVKLETALEASQKSDVLIYSIDISDRMFYVRQGAFFSGDAVLRKLSDQTGGRVIEVKAQRDVSKAFEEIADELRTQYSLGYSSTNTRHDGSFRKIQMKVRNQDYKVQARRGYYAPTE